MTSSQPTQHSQQRSIYNISCLTLLAVGLSSCQPFDHKRQAEEIHIPHPSVHLQDKQNKLTQTEPLSPLSQPHLANTNNERKTSTAHKSKPSAQARTTLKFIDTKKNGIDLRFVRFDDRDHKLVVADQPAGPGTRWFTARQCAESQRGLAAINGGFFTPEGKPLGKIVSQGRSAGYINPSSLGTGFYYTSATETQLIRRQKWSNSLGAVEALQTGPFLIENGKKTSGLNTSNQRVRSFIIWNGQHHWAIGYSSICSLNDLAAALNSDRLVGFPIKYALNLDGGRSSDMWVSADVPHGKKEFRAFWNKDVRNFLVLKER
ncbi:phosphodiester glycosidase family protein [Persicirhabdus sediminis]|uniref:Phosphodiester glycosidase family protein n=1 Tax=Persicirhabdus sediminis TaxID=454144 RepID=A0A8J7MCN4_9BACT|nr:phosphodiester glycosidase family protein [Persicirhabdus sediminis]MBK1790081.1 phosphodiester glycosidase family protein [Persicirhabdus sediminis]